MVARSKHLDESSDKRYDFISNSHLATVLESSIWLKFSHVCLLISTVPLAFDTILDLEQSRHPGFGPFFPMDLQIRITILLCNIIPSAVYLATTSFWFCPLLFIMCYFLVFGAILKIVFINMISTECDPPIRMLLLSFTSYCTCVVLFLFGLVDNNKMTLQIMSNCLHYFCIPCCIFAMISWFYNLMKRAKSHSLNETSNFFKDDREKVCFIFVVVFLLLWLGTITSDALTESQEWFSSSETNLVSYVGLQYFFMVPATILPGRFARSNRFHAEKLLEQKRAYVRYVSHEIRSPLNVVSAGLDLLAQELSTSSTPDSKKASIELVGDITDATETAINILNDLLQYESVDAGNVIIDPVPVQLNMLLQTRKLMMICTRRGIEMIVEDSSTHELEGTNFLYVKADIYRIDQVIRNLVSNSCKFTPQGGTILVRSLIELFHDKDDKGSDPIGKLIISVEDTGIGIAAQNKAHVFGEFKQFDKNNLQSGGGSGLGLWICKKIIEMHGGSIGFSSEGQGKGTKFYFELPVFFSSSVLKTMNDIELTSMATSSQRSYVVRKISPEEIITQPSTEAHSNDDGVDIESGLQMQEGNVGSGSDADACHLRVLLVDDSFMNRKIVRRMLDAVVNITFDISEAEDGVDAIILLKDSISALMPFDLVLMDSIMKIKNGPETVEIFRNELKFRGMIAGLTGNALPEDISEFTSKGLDLCLIKPLKKTFLNEAIEKAIARKTYLMLHEHKK